MGHRLTASEETAALKATIREAHEATKTLRAAIKEAKELGATLVTDFERIHATEIRQLSNHFTEESNRHAASLNADIKRAKDMIFNQIMSGELVLDPQTGTVRLRLGGGRFDEHVPPPYPQVAPKEEHQ
ncbi:MAG TPA: hypothetical protein VL179_08905 [Mycobacterium sp.]|nr:hypothetical protein [Mycobacterium sp.]